MDPNQQNVPDGVTHVPTQPDIPSDQGVQVRQSEFTAQVVDDHNKPLTSSPATSHITIEIPADSGVLETLSKGPDENSVTWYASYWLRMVKKAAAKGWGVVTRKS